jgi:hypothetical protein
MAAIVIKVGIVTVIVIVIVAATWTDCDRDQ